MGQVTKKVWPFGSTLGSPVGRVIRVKFRTGSQGHIPPGYRHRVTKSDLVSALLKTTICIQIAEPESEVISSVTVSTEAQVRILKNGECYPKRKGKQKRTSIANFECI